MTENRIALYFGCFGGKGHFLHKPDGGSKYDHFPGCPWDVGLMDTGLLKNGKLPDVIDGRVRWTCGGRG